jgi:two-component system, NtrC family, nitrogen regulation sensor histidine kinase NtrY
LSIKVKLIIIIMVIFAVFLATAILISIGMLSSAISAGQGQHTSQVLGLSVDLLRISREKKQIPEDSLNIYEKQVLAAMADYKQRQVCKDDLLRKLAIVLLLNAVPFFILGYFAIAFSVSRTIRPVMRLTKNIARYPDLRPADMPADPHADKEVRLLTDQFRTMLESIERYQKQLSARSKLDGWMEMSRAIVHEVGNAISPARNAIDLLKQRDPDNANVLAAAKSIARMEEIFRHIRQFYKSGEIARAPFDISQELRFICRGFGAEFQDRTRSDSIIVTGGKTECIQLFTNLIKNAAEAARSSEKPVVRAELTLDDTCMRIMVGNNGSGIAHEALGRIFSPGYTTKSEGMGIGLALVQKFITLHDWAISVVSIPGEETRFTVTIPKRDILERTDSSAR